METRQGKIEEKFLKFATNKAPYATFVIDGLKYNTFDKEIIDNHNPDDFVEIEGEQGKKFWTMQTMKKINEPQVMASPHDEQAVRIAWKPEKNGAKEYHLSPEEVKCRALECAIATKICKSEAEAFELANQFVEWIYGS